MDCILENEKEQQFRKRIIYSAIRNYGAVGVAEMCGLRVDQTDLVYKYSNRNSPVDVPDYRWRLLSQGLTAVGDTSIVREYTDPSKMIVVYSAKETNGSILDELQSIMKLNGLLSQASENGDIEEIDRLSNELNVEITTLIEELK